MNSQKKNNKKWIVIISLLAIILIGGACFTLINNKDKKIGTQTEIYYEILDESVLSDKGILNSWVKENAQNKGTYFTKNNDDTYILISDGATTQQGVGICLEDVTIRKDIAIKYSVINPNSEGSVDEYTPKMIIKVPTTSKNVTFEEVNAE